MTSIIDQNGHRLYPNIFNPKIRRKGKNIYLIIFDKWRYKVNGNPILIRGAGWAPDLFLRTDPIRQETEFKYILDINFLEIFYYWYFKYFKSLTFNIVGIECC